MTALALVIAFFAAATGLAFLPKRARALATAVALFPMVATFLWAASAAAGAIDGTIVERSIDWIPALGVGLDLRFDALALVFTLLVTGVGGAVVVFSRAYLGPAKDLRRFLALLVAFAGSMVGLVASDNVFGLFVFWEATTIVSYLLIGFEDEKGSARASALQAVLTTGAGGLALLGGLVILSQEASTTAISAIIAAPPTGTAATVALGLVLVGAFTKSAQVPFHFWLPGAMAAPTPASAYLHSATMVKAGILLLLRLAPGFSGAWLWAPVVVTAGLATMIIGAWRALRQTDLKLLLAYGTISQLGMITALIGVGTPALVHAALAVVVAHALFKSALFLVVGAVDATCGTRDVRMLSGLRRRMPLLAAGGALAAASMAGVAPLLGFVTKEAAFDALLGADALVSLAVIGIGSALTAAYALRFWWGAFGTKSPDGETRPPVGQSTAPLRVGLMVPALVLAAAGLVAGIVPESIDSLIGAAAPGGKLVLWPGWKPALAVSVAALVVGVALHLFRNRVAALQSGVSRVLNAARAPSADGAYGAALSGLNRTADAVTGVVQNGSLPVYLAVILTTVIAAPTMAWLIVGEGTLSAAGSRPAEWVLGTFVVGATLAVVRAVRRLSAAILLGAVGYSVAGLFVVAGAPDLALTLLIVETITVAVFAFVLTRLPRRFEEPRPGATWARGAFAFAIGAFITLAAIASGGPTPSRDVSASYVAGAPEAGGRNVVNVILTDFRGLDTLGEITVLAVAAIGVGALVRGFTVGRGDR